MNQEGMKNEEYTSIDMHKNLFRRKAIWSEKGFNEYNRRLTRILRFLLITDGL